MSYNHTQAQAMLLQSQQALAKTSLPLRLPLHEHHHLWLACKGARGACTGEHCAHALVSALEACTGEQLLFTARSTSPGPRLERHTFGLAC